VGIKLNDIHENFSNTHKILSQGDPLPPLLCKLVSDALAIMLHAARVNGQIHGLVPHLIEGGIAH
jgi:hypothetical protein